MGHPELVNRTPFVLDSLFVADENGTPLCVPVLKATFRIGDGGALSVAEEQLPLSPSGSFRGDPAESSCIYEPETAFFKPATDVVLIGHAYPEFAGATEVLAGISVGPVRQVVKVIGDRAMVRQGETIVMTPPRPFERIPLVYERAFGGWDRRHPDPAYHRFEERNPIGTGFRDPSFDADDELRLPNLEDPERPTQFYGDRPPPVGFGFVSPNWAPRRHFVGTYDEVWASTRSPLLPEDFDRRFFNAAAPGLVAPGYLKGDEPVIVRNAASERRLAFRLPGVPRPVCQYELRGRKRIKARLDLDTVIVNTDEMILILIWRTHFRLPIGPHDVVFLRMHTKTHPFSFAER
jgi:hypothetical protein